MEGFYEKYGLGILSCGLSRRLSMFYYCSAQTKSSNSAPKFMMSCNTKMLLFFFINQNHASFLS